jgi:hypothetical protein
LIKRTPRCTPPTANEVSKEAKHEDTERRAEDCENQVEQLGCGLPRKLLISVKK